MRTPTSAIDGRRTRWEQHRATRRGEIVLATLRAIREHGAGVGMDDIAAMAGTSKTVVYRHFADRAALHAAVVEHVESQIIGALVNARDTQAGSTSDVTPQLARAVLAAMVDAYLALVEADTEVYRFVVVGAGPACAAGDPPVPVNSHVARHVAQLLASTLASAGRPVPAADLRATAIVGMIRGCADAWVFTEGGSPRMPRDELAEHLTAMIWDGMAPWWP